MAKIDLLLVNPSNKAQIYGKLAGDLSGIEPPLWTALIAAYMRNEGFSVKIIDADAENLSIEAIAEQVIELQPVLVGVAAIGANPSASSTPKMAAARRMLNLLKGKNIITKTFLYGIHPSALPERTLNEEAVDFVCRGECFYTVSKLLKVVKLESKHKNAENNYSIKGLSYIKDGSFIDNGWGEVVDDLDRLPFAAWDLLPMDKYRAHNWHCLGSLNKRSPYATIYTSLGCSYNCKYCNIHTLYSGKPGIRYRSPERVIQEFELLINRYQIRNFKIIDELFALDENRVLKLCDLLIQRNYDLNIWAYARIDTVTEKMLTKMKKAGINWLCYGIESANTDVRKGVTKDRFNEKQIHKAIKMTHDTGIYIIGNFMFGLPDDSLETMQQTLSLAQDLNCEYVTFYSTMAYPGSQLYNDALKKGIKLPDTWIGYSQFNSETLPLPTRYLTASEVLSFRDKAFIEYYSSPRYLNMIAQKFGQETVCHIKEMLKYEVYRKLLEPQDKQETFALKRKQHANV